MTTTAVQPSFLFLWFLTLRWHFESEASWNCLVQTCQEWGFWGLVGKDEGKDQRHPSLHHTACSGKNPSPKLQSWTLFSSSAGKSFFFSKARLRNVFSPHFGKPGYRRHETGGGLPREAFTIIKVTKYIHSALWESWKAEVNRWKSKNQAP